MNTRLCLLLLGLLPLLLAQHFHNSHPHGGGTKGRGRRRRPRSRPNANRAPPPGMGMGMNGAMNGAMSEGMGVEPTLIEPVQPQPQTGPMLVQPAMNNMGSGPTLVNNNHNMGGMMGHDHHHDISCKLGKCRSMDNCPNPRTENRMLFEHVCIHDGTERPYTGVHNQPHGPGVYKCSCCGNHLFDSGTKFDSGTGWPSFYQPFNDSSVIYKEDFKMGVRRIEVICAKCGAHLGHVFPDGPPPTGDRYCINSVCLDFEPDAPSLPAPPANAMTMSMGMSMGMGMGMVPQAELETAVLAGGCFWGLEMVFDHVIGVEDVVVGYSGGRAETAQYKTIMAKGTNHAESVEIKFDPSVVSFAQLLDVFFEVAHDPTTLNAAHPDYGRMYRSVIFYATEEQRKVAEQWIMEATKQGLFQDPIVTEVVPLEAFYPAEDYHQDFGVKNPAYPYIQVWDVPKVVKLQEKFPGLFNNDMGFEQKFLFANLFGPSGFLGMMNPGAPMGGMGAAPGGSQGFSPNRNFFG